MKKIIIYLTFEQYRQIKERAYKDNVTMSQIVRSSLDNFFSEQSGEKRSSSIAELPSQQNPSDPRERYLFDPEVIKLYREFKSAK